MKRKWIFYLVIAALTVIDSFLLSKPNLLGQIGLIIYKYHYLRTFPRTMLTVSIVVIVSFSLTSVIHYVVKTQMVKRFTGTVFFLILIVLATFALIKTGLDFSNWSYAHTGHKFKYGAYLLPLMLDAIFIHGLIGLPNSINSIPKLPLSNVDDINQKSYVDSQS